MGNAGPGVGCLGSPRPYVGLGQLQPPITDQQYKTRHSGCDVFLLYLDISEASATLDTTPRLTWIFES